MRGAIPVFLVLTLGCGGDATEARDTGGPGDDVEVGGDGAVADSATASGTDSDVGLPDADQGDSVAAEIADSAAPDVAETLAPDTGAPDAAPDEASGSEVVDASPSDVGFPTDRPRGQCVGSDDCPGTLFCAETAPGGICNGCGADPCPAGTSCNEFGACARGCAGDEDCPVGLRCHPTQDICALKSCSLDVDCEAPFVCDSGFCRRPSCGGGSACPAPLACEAGVCVEPYWAESMR